MESKQPLSAARLPNALLTIDTVCAMTGLPRTFIYRAKDFPAPARIGNSRQMRWHSAAVNDWIAAQKPSAPKVAA
jgi:predicted DNA-binding transcriptional regulator AlpA